jgi:hypothetical protein
MRISPQRPRIRQPGNRPSPLRTLLPSPTPAAANPTTAGANPTTAGANLTPAGANLTPAGANLTPAGANLATALDDLTTAHNAKLALQTHLCKEFFGWISEKWGNYVVHGCDNLNIRVCRLSQPCKSG